MTIFIASSHNFKSKIHWCRTNSEMKFKKLELMRSSFKEISFQMSMPSVKSVMWTKILEKSDLQTISTSESHLDSSHQTMNPNLLRLLLEKQKWISLRKEEERRLTFLSQNLSLRQSRTREKWMKKEVKGLMKRVKISQRISWNSKRKTLMRVCCLRSKRDSTNFRNWKTRATQRILLSIIWSNQSLESLRKLLLLNQVYPLKAKVVL